MRVAIDEQIFAIQRFGGISRYFAELSQQFLEDPELGIDLFTAPTPVYNDYLIRGLHGRAALPATFPASKLRATAHMLVRRRRRGNVDVVHHTFYMTRFLKDFRGAKRVITVYDMIPERFPGAFKRQDLLTSKRAFIERADEIICISHATREDLLHFMPDIAANVTVVHLGVDFDFFSRPTDPLPDWPAEYLLFVGKRDGYKDASTLVRAFERLAGRFPALHLVFVGGGSLTDGERRDFAARGIDRQVHHEELSDALMPAAYAHARAFVFPSQYEGFGLPALEAMASGTPTILCRAASLPEVGGDAAIYFDPGDDRLLAEVLEAALQDAALADRLLHAGRARAQEFTWARTARRTVGAYRGQ